MHDSFREGFEKVAIGPIVRAAGKLYRRAAATPHYLKAHWKGDPSVHTLEQAVHSKHIQKQKDIEEAWNKLYPKKGKGQGQRGQQGQRQQGQPGAEDGKKKKVDLIKKWRSLSTPEKVVAGGGSVYLAGEGIKASKKQPEVKRYG